ncbi:MAG: glycosyltransferase family 4 protein, partial [Candidatus Omnitrophica bacterium]|nr:glycosyltransferase family 4 protein [Candidatus Omnitrophota bacterium]
MKESSKSNLIFHKRILIAHDWLTGMRGGEQVLEAILELFPNSEIFTLFFDKNKISPAIASHPIHTSFLQIIKPLGLFKYYRHTLPLMPLAISLTKVKSYDLILSTSHCVAKGIPHTSNINHISYIHTPMRYIWDMK